MLFVNLDPNKNLSYIQIRERGLEKVKEKGNCVLECAIPLYDKASTKEKKDKLMKRRKQSSTVTLHLTRSPECLEYTGMHHRARSALVCLLKLHLSFPCSVLPSVPSLHCRSSLME